MSTLFHKNHDLLLRSYLYHCVRSVITVQNLTPEKRDNNYSAWSTVDYGSLHTHNQLQTMLNLYILLHKVWP